MELMGCPALAVPLDVMQHVVRVESSFNPYAIGVVGGRLARQPRNLSEAVATARMLEARGYNFSLGLAQVNRYNLDRYGLPSYEKAFEACPNLQAGSRILAECQGRAGGDWGKAFSCYYSGNFTTGYRHGYVQKIFASMQDDAPAASRYPGAIPLAGAPARRLPVPIRAPAKPPAPGRTDASWSQRIVQPARPITAVPAMTVNAALAVPATAADVSEQETGVAVLNTGGRPPQLVPAAGGAPAPDAVHAPAPPDDSAFVF
jgi:type IV secretion system protein VirB1